MLNLSVDIRHWLDAYGEPAAPFGAPSRLERLLVEPRLGFIAANLRSREDRSMQRGEVWLATIDDRAAVIVLSVRHDLIRAIRVVPPADQLIEGVMREMTLGDSAGLTAGVVRIAIPGAGFVPCQWVVNLSETDLVERLGQLSIDKLAELDELLLLAELES